MSKNILLGLYFITAATIMIMIMLIPGYMVFEYSDAAGWLPLTRMIVITPTIIVSVLLGGVFGVAAQIKFEKFIK